MGWSDAVKASTAHRIHLGGRAIDYRIVRSKAARKLRVRVGPDGVEVVQPASRNGEEVSKFLSANSTWICDQLERAERVRHVRRTKSCSKGEILFRGELTRVRIETTGSRSAGNAVRLRDGEIVVSQGAGSRTPVWRSLENWLRRQARRTIDDYLGPISMRVGQRPTRVYVMSQRTKWGNCSSRRNLSFNWRLIFAPDYVIRYLVTHEMVHLVIPDHSAKFWLTVQSACRESERARQWLAANGRRLLASSQSLLQQRT
jgi:predicted metal-dependent hydrolase